MKVVIDTNLLVSAVLPERVILWCIAKPGLDWLVTAEILEEYRAVLRRPKFALPRAIVAQWLDLLTSRVRLIEADPGISFARDTNDAKFLHCAAAGGADYLVTGDRDFEDAHPLIPTSIVSARQFAAEHAPTLLTQARSPR